MGTKQVFRLQVCVLQKKGRGGGIYCTGQTSFKRIEKGRSSSLNYEGRIAGWSFLAADGEGVKTQSTSETLPRASKVGLMQSTNQEQIEMERRVLGYTDPSLLKPGLAHMFFG